MNNRARPGRLTQAGIGACLLLVTTCPSFVHAQSSATENWEKAAGTRISFDVVSVKLDKDTSADPNSNVDLGPMASFSPTGGLLRASNIPLLQYIAFAYKLSPEEAKRVQLQLPKWADTNEYDIVARASGNPTKDQYRLMMQSLLADRFQLALHYETKDMSVMALTLDKPGKLGPSLRDHKNGVPCTTASATEGTAEPTTTGGFPVQCDAVVHLPSKTSGVTRMGARAVDSSVLASVLGVWDQADEPVVDETGLGVVDFIIEFTPDRMTNKGLEYNPDALSFVEALKKQLGLRFESRRAPVRSMIIDQIEQPAPN